MNNKEQKAMYEYCEEHSNVDSDLLLKINKYTWENEDIPQMISGQLVGKFLQSIILMSKAKNILEIGTFTGYSALQMAEALPPDGKIHTCELMNKHANTAKLFFEQSKHKDQIIIHQGPAIKTLEQLQANSFDLAFIDADKKNYLEYYKRSYPLIRQGGIIILDNMLWSNTVINPKDDEAKMLRKTGDFIQSDNRVFNILFPIRDGLMLCYKI